MMKHVLLASSMVMSAPALAQTAAPAPATQATPTNAAPQTATPAPQTAAPADPAAPMDSTPPAAGQTGATEAAPAAAEPATTGASQVAQVVDGEFGTYDANGDGNLDRIEFAAWMVKLKTASDPSTKADSAATRTWLTGAFAQADTNKSKSVDKAELTGFLSQGAS